MKYFTEIDAVEELESVEQTDGIMLTAEDCLMRMDDQRLLIQSLLLDPPEQAEDERLQKMLRGQTTLWLEKIEECGKMQVCIRLPDRPIDSFLPRTEAEFERLGSYAGRSAEWLKGQKRGLQSFNPELSCRGCRMMIGNGLLFRTLLQAIFTAAKERSISKLSMLLPFVSDCGEVEYLKGIITEYAEAYGIACTVGIEIATPRAACIADQLATYADAIVFNVEELVQLLYGMCKLDSRKVISKYLHEQVFRHNPFREFDDVGVGTLLTIALERIRSVRPDIRLSAIGHCVLSEKGRKFCGNMGIDILIGQQHLLRAENILGSEELTNL